MTEVKKEALIDFNINIEIDKLLRWKWWIAAATVLAGVLSIIVSFQVPDEYRAVTSFIPPKIGTLLKGGAGDKGFDVASENDIDQTIEYLSSYPVIDSLATEFDLYNKYRITKGTKNADKVFYLRFGKKHLVSFGDRSTVTIDCFDEDPETAYKLALKYLQFSRDFFERVSNRKAALDFAELKLKELKERKQEIQDTLQMFRIEHKLFSLLDLGDASDKIVAAKLASDPGFLKNYDHMVSLEQESKIIGERLAQREEEYMIRKLNFEQFPELIQITREPIMPTFKARPKRSIIVAIAVIATFVFSIFLALLLDKKAHKGSNTEPEGTVEVAES